MRNESCKNNIKISLIIPVDSHDVEKFNFLIKNLKNNIKYLFEIIAVLVTSKLVLKIILKILN